MYMRVIVVDKDRERLFTTLQEKDINIRQIAETVGVCIRTVSDWRRGKYTIPSEAFQKLTLLGAIDQASVKREIVGDWWHNREAGEKGARVTMQRHGPPGTPEGRRKGGKNSYAARRGRAGEIFTPKSMRKPRKSVLLAEFIGILIGDGGMTRYQVVVTTNSVDDYEYSLFIANLSQRLFGMMPNLSERKDSQCITIVTSSVELVKFLKTAGILQGDKLKQNLNVPTWIFKNKAFEVACLRGMFDTDGCVFQERHKIKGKMYCYPRLSFVSASEHLRLSIYNILEDLEFTPKIRNNRSVNLERRCDIESYFRVVGTSNPKHLNRFKSFGGVG